MEPRSEYPRPTLVRQDWRCLNGLWRFRRDEADEGLGARWHHGLPEGDEEILVPFAVESEQSGIQDRNPPAVVWYERTFEVPSGWGDRVLLRLGASDYRTRAFVNGQSVGAHEGGYSPMAFEIGDVLVSGTNRLVIRVEDSPSWSQPRGKQAGTFRWPIDYDSVTGIWQTIWLEPLPDVSIDMLHPVWYALFLSAALSKLFNVNSISKEYNISIWTPIIAGFCDFAENAIHAPFIYGVYSMSQPWIFMGASFATVKWVLAAGATTVCFGLCGSYLLSRVS